MPSREIHNPLAIAQIRAVAAVIAALFAGALVLSGVFFAASPAAAHDELVSSTPAAGDTVEGVPAEISLVFSGTLSTEPGATAIEVLDEAGASVVSGAPVVADTTVTQALDAAADASGTVRVLWKVVSSDGHPISGEYAFTVTAPPAPEPTAEPSPSETATAEPTTPPATVEPTPMPTEPADEDSTFGDVWLWVVLGLIAAVVAGALLYLGVSRVRRDQALRERE